jgi:hypothetical protein
MLTNLWNRIPLKTVKKMAQNIGFNFIIEFCSCECCPCDDSLKHVEQEN